MTHNQRMRLSRIFINTILAAKDANVKKALKTKARRNGISRKIR
jgi:hypothetical protein